jgi:HAD superfamily hydrolase (TIGR01549 family)
MRREIPTRTHFDSGLQTRGYSWKVSAEVVAKRFSAVIFDLDGTLIEVEDIKRVGDEILMKTLLEFGVERTSFKQRHEFWFSGGKFLHLLNKWGFRSQKDVRSFLESLSRNEYDEKKRLIESGKVRLYRDADILGQLHRELKLGLVSNSSSRTVSLELDSFRIREHFDSILGLGDFTNNLRPKPDPDGIIRCLEELNESPSTSIVVGDNLTDMLAGDRSGTHTALVVRESQQESGKIEKSRPVKAEFKVKTLHELLKTVLP